MSFFGQLFGGAFAFLIIGTVGFVFWPSDPCQRIANGVLVAQIVFGSVPRLEEALSKQDRAQRWDDVERLTAWIHERSQDYFGVSGCVAPAFDVYRQRAEDYAADEWLLRNDPELYRLLEAMPPLEERL